jgi:hypothetical protein
MIRTVGHALTLCALLLAGCATAHPNFEQTFRGGRPSHDQWMSLLMTRYGCDTALVVAAMPERWNGVGLPPLVRERARPMELGMTACDLASVIAPEVVDAWVSPDGIREEWKYRQQTRRGEGDLVSVYLEGHDTNALQIAPPLPAQGRGRDGR